jgi:dTDP-glucose pyrophosphorylase
LRAAKVVAPEPHAGMLNLVIPMAGLGSRFAEAGYRDPKPLIQMHGVPMIRLIIDNLRPAQPHRFIFIGQAAHVQAYGLEAALQRWAPGCEIVQLDGVTEGAACTVLHAADVIDNEQPLMIANSDQYLAMRIDDYLAFCARPEIDGCIMTMTASDPKWSFAAVDGRGFVTDVREKEPISHHATTGVYNFSRGADFVRAARQMISADKRVNGEFYVAPVYNELIAEGACVAIFDIGPHGDGMFGLGTPADFERFAELPLSRQVTAASAT